MHHEIALTAGAEQDLEDIYRYLARTESRARANHVLERLLSLADSLAEGPSRGSRPKELLALGIQDYRQAIYKPYRVIYRISGDCVLIHLIADGRRDMQSLLARRLLGG